MARKPRTGLRDLCEVEIRYYSVHGRNVIIPKCIRIVGLAVGQRT